MIRVMVFIWAIMTGNYFVAIAMVASMILD